MRLRVLTSRVTPHAATIVSILFATLYLLTALPRIFYPYDLDFIEDGMLMESIRFANGQPVFLPLNADFMPHVYMPLYSWLGGLLFKLFGVGFAPLRLLSFGATISTAAMIYFIAKKEGGQNWIAIACAGLFLGGYRLTGFWYELARVDSLYVALALGGLAAGFQCRADRSLKTCQLLAAILLALAFFTKQTGLAFGIGMAIYLLIVVGRRAWVFVVTFAALTLIPLFTLNSLTGGWFIYHTFTIASGDPLEIGRVARYVGLELFGAMAGLSLMALAAGALGIQRAGLRIVREQPWFVGIGLAAVVSGVGRASVGGNLNNLMPVYALLCLAPVLLIRELSHRKGAKDAKKKEKGKVFAFFASSRLILSLGVILQFILGAYNPLRYIPTAEMRESGDRLVERIKSVDGEVLVLMHPYYAWLAGKAPSAQMATIWYIYQWQGVPLPDDFVARIENQYYAAIISDESLFETEPAIRELIAAHDDRPAGEADGDLFSEVEANMKHVLLLATSVALLSAACGSALSEPLPATLPTAPTPTQPPIHSTPTTPPSDLTPAQLAAIGALSSALGIPPDQIGVTSTEAVDWPDACLGVTQTGVMCAQVITPGFRIVLAVNGRPYEYHTDADGRAVVAVTAASVTLTWHREGGLARFCDDLNVYLSGKAVASSCQSGETYPEGTLTEAELGQLYDWSARFGALAVEMKDPATADAMTVILTFNGSGYAEPTEADRQAMSLWAGEIYGRLKK